MLNPFQEERSRLLDNPTLEHCKRSSSPNEEHYNTEKVYTSIGAQMDFHCHDMSTSTGKVREVSSRSAKQKLLVACVLVILFIILEVSRSCDYILINIFWTKLIIHYPKLSATGNP